MLFEQSQSTKAICCSFVCIVAVQEPFLVCTESDIASDSRPMPLFGNLEIY